MAAWVALLSMVLAEPVVLDNGHIRVEVEPALFAIQFVGHPGGSNFVESLHVNEEGRLGKQWVEPGGAYVELIPELGKDPAIMRGPARVLAKRSDYVALLGPVSETYGVRVRKEVELEVDVARARFTVTVMAMTDQRRRLSVRHVVQVPSATQLHVAKAAGLLHILPVLPEEAPFIVDEEEFWTLRLHEFAATEPYLVRASSDQVIHEDQNGGRWVRRSLRVPSNNIITEATGAFVGEFDNRKANRLAALQGDQREVTASVPLVFIETWALERAAASPVWK